MESAKNQISLPEVVRFEKTEIEGEIHPGISGETSAFEDEFQLIQVSSLPTFKQAQAPEPERAQSVTAPSVPSVEDFEPGQKAISGDSEYFVLPKYFWKTLNSDPGIRAEIERIINETVESKTAATLESRFNAMKPQVMDAAREEGHRTGYDTGYASGFSLGRAEGHEAWRLAQVEVSRLQALLDKTREEIRLEASDRLNHLSMEILEQKETLLKGHEKAWTKALLHLLKRFMVKDHDVIGPQIEQWLGESLNDYSKKQKIQVYLAPEDYERQMHLASPKLDDKWEIIKDTTLNKGEVRYECGGGGVFFSGAEEFKRLEQLLEKLGIEGLADVA